LLPGAEIRLDAAGRMAVRSPYVDGWQQTEDLVERVADGFRFLGRADRIVKVEGKRVDLLAIEAALMGLPWVEAAAVVAMPGLPTRLGGLLVLTVAGHERLRASGPFQFGRLLRRALSAQMEPAGLPRVWRFADALPARALGKRHDAAIVSLFEASHP
jgi:acyl-coenzyme A synthetase/AMP-(fatty) acid ligase